MRVLTVGNMYPPHALGGYEVTWESCVTHLMDHGHEVDVLTTGFRLRAATGHRDPLHVHRDLRWYWHDHDFPTMSSRERLALERANARVLDSRLARFKPDIVCWWAMGGMSLSLIERVRRAGLPAVGVVGDDWMVYGPQRDGWLGPMRGGRTRRVAGVAATVTGVPTSLDLGAAAHWLFVSEGIRAASRASWDLPSTEICHPGVDTGRLGPVDPAPWRWRLAVIGRIDPRKGIDVAIRALALLPTKATLTITGTGDDRHLAELRALAQSLGMADRITFQARSRDEVASAYADADALLFPVTWEEPWGLVPLEAMAVGRPVVTSGRGGQAAYLRDGDNSLVTEPDPAAFAAAVQRLAGDPSLRERLTADGRRTAAAHTARAYDERIEAALGEALA